MRAHGLVRSGAMQSLANLVHEATPHAMAICEIDAGDALALATRFALQWAYRGRQALFWREPFVAHAVHDVYLPLRATRPFDRRGLLSVEAELAGVPCALLTTQFSNEREAYLPELRFARSYLRRAAQHAIVFALVPQTRVTFEDLGFTPLANEQSERVYVRAFQRAQLRALVTRV